MRDIKINTTDKYSFYSIDAAIEINITWSETPLRNYCKKLSKEQKEKLLIANYEACAIIKTTQS
jgi:hypothetical protein